LVSEHLAGLGDVAIARPGEVIGYHRRLVRRQHVQHFYARGRRLLRIGVVGKFHPRLFEQQHRMVREIAEAGGPAPAAGSLPAPCRVCMRRQLVELGKELH
jgi:hypothetical protein